jgi:hypothetical protein
MKNPATKIREWKNTMVELVVELEQLSESTLRERLIQSAKAGDFHDFKSKAVCGKMYFLTCAKWFKENIWKVSSVEVADSDIKKIIKMETDIKNGEYDEKPDKWDRKETEKILGEFLSGALKNGSSK